MLDPVRESYRGDDELLIVNRSQDVQPLIDANRAFAEAAPSKHGQAAWRLAGRIPAVIAELWAKECGAGIGSQEFNAYVKRKLLDGDFAAFRVKGF
jgi:hypothetical protein